ncbi:hypothetical protein DRH27_02580 [Candidatus Falkowbacteria bacterium]|nr:MAG: hypothetical protein DRH27_02580 [Candidatus Falkowbacteria bacterium]
MPQAGLGRGLGSLIPNKARPIGEKDKREDSLKNDNEQVLEVSIDEINTNPMQPRHEFNKNSIEELVVSIKEHGIIQPLIATKNNGQYELIAGERRLRAAKSAGLGKVPVIIRNVNKQQKLEVALIENIQRENLNAIDLARAYEKLMEEFNLTQEQVAKKVGKSRPVIANAIRLLNLPQNIKSALIEGRINEGHAKYLIGFDDEKKQTSLFKKILHSNLTVDDTNKLVKKMGGTKAARIKINYKDKDKEFKFREFFGTKVEIKRKGKGGQIIIDFFSDEELEEMAEKVK